MRVSPDRRNFLDTNLFGGDVVSQRKVRLTKQRAADFMGVSLRQLERYVEQGMPREGARAEARYGPGSFAWFRDYQTRKNEAGRVAGALADEMARKTQIEADRAELKLLKEQGELVTIRSVCEKQVKANFIIRDKLLALPTKMAPLIVGMKKTSQVKARFETEIQEILMELTPPEGKRARPSQN